MLHSWRPMSLEVGPQIQIQNTPYIPPIPPLTLPVPPPLLQEQQRWPPGCREAAQGGTDCPSTSPWGSAARTSSGL